MRSGIRFIVWSVATISAVHASDAQVRRSRTEYGLAIDYRRQLGTLPDSVDRRKGLAIRIQADQMFATHFGWRIEGGYAQVQYKRNDPLGQTPINETNIELGGFIRAFPVVRQQFRAYALAGPVASLRASCDVDTGFNQTDMTPCRTTDDYLVGWGAGGGLMLANWVGGWNWFVESKYLSNVTAAGGGNLIAISFGATGR